MTDESVPNSRISVIELVEGQPVKSNWDDFLKLRSDPNRLFRIELFLPDPVTLENRLSDLHASALLIERCLDSHIIAGVHVYEDVLAIQLPVAEDWDSAAHPKLTFLCFTNALVMICTSGKSAVSKSGLDDQQTIAKRTVSLEGMLFSALDSTVDRASDLTLKTRLSVDQLETDMLATVDNEQLRNRILTLKRKTAQLEMALEAKHQTLMALLPLETNLIDLDPIYEPLHDVIAHVEHSLRYVERIEDRLDELDRHYLMMLQDKTNNRLRILTIISAIFMPLSLIAGIYGMNFKVMPELSWHYGYALVLLCMFCIALGLLIYFKTKDWFQ